MKPGEMHATVDTQSALVEKFEGISISHSILSKIPYDIAVEYFTLPYRVDDKGRLEVLMAYPHDPGTIQAVQMHAGALVCPRKAGKDQLMKLVAIHYGRASDQTAGSPGAPDANRRGPDRLSYNSSATTIAVVDDIIHEAVRLRASDIHLEPFEREMRVRFRIDGVLQEMMNIPRERVPEVCSRVKVMSRMDIAEKRRAQDGRIRMAQQGKDIDVRVSTLPTDFGEKLVLRILDKTSFEFTLENLGMEDKRLGLFKRAIQMPNGIVLLTGPTGSGKTTTLYGGINYLKKPGVNISTVEDPIEYNIPGVNQTQVKPEIGVTFAGALRTLLRQDPDIIMVGEMRDRETAEIAIRASLTGHLVLSTLHTNDAASAATRLVDMGIEPYLVSSAVTLIVAQRLVRRICAHCKCEESVPDEIKKELVIQPGARLYKGLGCSACGQTGYRGRVGIFEVLPISDTIRKRINEKAYTEVIRNEAIKEGLVTLRENALAQLTSGVTSLEEVVREISVIA
ncbi:MAG: type II secretion system protein GspE [Chitinivibrionales bacterium]|nr:type II secretion system protein GspE [Chitinivibrionales bacterium]MBD3396406.1 type II secretion system protein GspE [Chitinivibrionales bacterium]